MEAPTPDHFFYLVDSSLDVDLRQDMFLALLSEHPVTELEATAIIMRVRYVNEYAMKKERQRTLPLLVEPSTDDKGDEDNGYVVAALNTLPDDDQDLIMSHVIEGHSLRTIAKVQGVSKDTIRKRFNLAKDKLISVVKKQ